MVCTIVGLCMPMVPLQAAEDEARVLILNGTDPYLPAYLVIDTAMRASLSQLEGKRVVFFSEPLDAQRFDVEKLEPEFLALFRKKYAGLHINVVVAVTQPALEFYKQHREQLWPDSRVVFHDGISRTGIQLASLPSYATGVQAREDIVGTIDIAHRLQPKARRIVVVSGSAEMDNRLLQQTRQLLSPKEWLESVEFLTGLPVPELEGRIAALPSDSIVLYLTQFRDRDGRPYTPREVLRAISNSSAAPVYALYDTMVGFGVAAGSMESFEERGRLVGYQVRSALTG